MSAISLCERLTFDKLFRMSEPKRVQRSLTVKGPPLEIDSYQDVVYYCFNFKANPSTTGLRHRGYVKFFKPANPRAKALQHLECLVDCTCFSGEALVLMADGTQRPIAEVQSGDFVYTHLGRVKKVTAVNARVVMPDENVYKLSVGGFPGEVFVTGQHPFLTLRGNETCLCGCGLPLFDEGTGKFKAEHRLFSPDLILQKKFRQGHAVKGQRLRDSGPHFEWTAVNDFRAQEWFLSPWLEPGKNAPVTAELARLFGYYVAEGCIPNKRGTAVRLTFNQNEWDTLVADSLSIAKAQGFIAEAKRRKWKKRRWVEVTIRNRDFRQFCIDQAGQGSKTKKLSDAVLAWTNELLVQVFAGMTLGDGWCDPERGVKFLSSNFNLISQASLILARSGVRYTVSLHGSGNGGKCRMWQVLVPRGESATAVRSWLSPFLRDKDLIVPDNDGLHRLHYRYSGGQLRNLVSCVPADYDGKVYDITVEDDASFIAQGVAVHNCPDYRYRWAWTNKQRGSGVVGSNSLNQAWNKAPRRTNPSGRSGLCKHILAARGYIYGLLSSFPGDEPDTAEKLNKLTKYAKKRWTDFPGAMAAAKERDKEMARIRALRNIAGRLPEPPPEKEPDEPLSVDARTSVPKDQKPASTVSFKKAQPPALPKKPAKPAKPAQAPLAIPPGERGRGFPVKEQPPQPHMGYGSKAEYDFYRRQGLGDSLMREIENPVTERVVNSNNGKSMSDPNLKQAIKLVQEMEDDILGGDTAAPEMPGDMGAPEAEPVEPMEPPISDTAIGADTEGDTALGLLTQMKELLTQIATAVAPSEGGLPGEEGDMPPGAEGMGDMPPEPLEDEEFSSEESSEEGDADDDDEDEGESFEKATPNRRPGK